MVLSFPLADSWMVTSVKVLEMLQVITAGLPRGTDRMPSVQIGLSQPVWREWSHMGKVELCAGQLPAVLAGHGQRQVTGLRKDRMRYLTLIG